jgi:hypothetical protein
VAPAVATSEPVSDAPALDEQAIDEISRWAEERGGQAKVIES